MPMIDAVGRSLYTESFGDPEDPALLLISGLTSQMTSWPDALCEAFVDRGFFVMRFDNRDCGFSTFFADGVGYTLSDMADDAIEVLNFHDVEQAHILGISMGAMIAQTVAIEHGDRALSLISYASTTGNPDFGRPTEEAFAALMGPEATTRVEAIEAGLVGNRIWGTEGTWSDEEWAKHCGDDFDRSSPKGGGARQFAAVLASGDRELALRQVVTPTLVIHGSKDPLINPSGGQRTAEVIPGATYIEIEDMGHDIPITHWPQIVSAITAHAVQAVSA